MKQNVNGTEIYIQFAPKQQNSICPIITEAGNRKTNFFNCLMENGTIVFEYSGPLIFINALIFRSHFYSMIGKFIVEMHRNSPSQTFTIIMDCSKLFCIDGKGVESLSETRIMMADFGCRFLLAACSHSVYESLEKYRYFENESKQCYLSVLDAIVDHSNH